MPTYVINGKRYNSPTPLSEDDLLEISGGSNAPAPARDNSLFVSPFSQEASQRRSENFQKVDDLVRAAANGLTFGWADRLAAGGNAALGNGDYASNVKQERQQSADAQKRNPYVYKGVEIGSGLVLPGVGLVKGASTGAQVANAAGNGLLFGGLGGAGMESGDTNPVKALTNAGTGALTGATIGAVATPLVNRGLEFASRFSPKVDNALTEGARVRNYEGNPTAQMDAEITRDIGRVKGGKRTDVLPKELNDLEGRYIDKTKLAADNAGILGDTENLALDRYRSLMADPEELAKLTSTAEGQAIFANLQKANRTNELTQQVAANNGFLPKTGRTLIDSGLLDAGIMAATGLPVPIASAARAGFKKALSGNSTRTEVIRSVGSDRGLKAADAQLALAGESEASKGLGVLSQAADDKLANEIGSTRERLMADRAIREKDFAEKGILGGGGNQTIKTQNQQLAGVSKEQYNAMLKEIASDPTAHPDVQRTASQLLAGENTNTGSTAFFSVQNRMADAVEKAKNGVLNQVNKGKLYEGQNVSIQGTPDITKMIYGMTDEQAARLVGKDSDTLGKAIESPKAYLNGQVSKAYETFMNGGIVKESDKALLKALGLI